MKRLAKQALTSVLIMVMVLFSCKKEEIVTVTGITLDKTTLTKTKGETEQLTATITPANAVNKTVTWSSSDENVATVDNNGKVTAVKGGKATITVTTKDGNKIATCMVIVKVIAITGVTLDKTTLTKIESGTEQLTATVTPTNATDKIVMWSSSDENVATVDNNGKVTAVKAGKATITVTTKDGNKTATCMVTVMQAKSIYIEFTTAKAVGEEIRLAINANEADQSNVWIDLNNNGTKDSGEAVTHFTDDHTNQTAYTLGAQTIRVYGKVTEFAVDYHYWDYPQQKYIGQQLTQLDVSQNTQLIELGCSFNKLTQLDVSQNTELKELGCNYNQLSNLDTSQNTNLMELYCRDNQLSNLDLSQNINLKVLYHTNNQLSSLDISKNTKLTNLYCEKNQLSSLDISKNTELKGLNCSKNQLSSLDISKNTKLKGLDCTKNQLRNLDTSKNTKLEGLGCSENQLRNLDVSQNINLTILYCNNNQLSSLDVSKNTKLTWLNCTANYLNSLDVSKNTELTSLYCGYNYRLSSLNVSKNTKLKKLYCHDNKLSSLDVSKNTKLGDLYCKNTYLTCIKVNATQLAKIPVSWHKDDVADYNTSCP